MRKVSEQMRTTSNIRKKKSENEQQQKEEGKEKGESSEPHEKGPTKEMEEEKNVDSQLIECRLFFVLFIFHENSKRLVELFH